MVDAHAGTNAADTAVQRAAMQRSLNQAIAYGDQTAKAKDMSEPDALAAYGRLTEELKTAKPDELSSLQVAQRAIAETIQARDKAFTHDPAGYILDNNKSVAASYAKFQNNPTPDAFAEYAGKTMAEQHRLYPDRAPALLTSDIAGSISDSLSGIPNNPDGAARAGVVLSQWGPNPKQNIAAFFDKWTKELTAAHDARGVQALDGMYQKMMREAWPVLTDEIGHPASDNVSRYLSVIRSTLNAARLGLSIFASIADVPLRARMLNHYNTRTTGAFFANLLHSTVAQLPGMGEGLSKADRQTLAAEAGIRLEAAHMPLGFNQADQIGFGRVARWNQIALKWAGHSWWSNRLRTNSVVADGFRHWSLRDRAFESLPVGLQRAFDQFGIGKQGWDVLRQQTATELDSGRKVFSPRAIGEMEPDKFRPLVGSESPTTEELKRARDDLQAHYRNFLGEMADRVTSTPSRAIRSIMNQGTLPNTVTGELMRGAMQLKTFTAGYMRNHLGQELAGYDTEGATMPQLFWRTVTGRNPTGAKGLALLIGSGVGYAYISNALHDIATGKTPENPIGPNWKDAMMRAFFRQSFGLYSDFLFSESRPDESLWDKLGDLAGPEAETAADIFRLGQRVFNQATRDGGFHNGDFNKDAQQALAFAYRNTPGNNLFWTKYALDFLVLNNISEMLNPGYQQRLIARAQERRGQTYLLGAGPQTATAH
jgi:hypothetical protein